MIELKKEVNELQLANIEIQDSRRAAVNLMEDALQTRQVAEALNVQLRHEIAERKRTEALMACQKEAFQMIASGALLREVLDFLARAIEGQSQERMAVAIHLLDESETTFIQTVAPSLPPSYMQATDGMLISSAAGPCCAAVSRRERVTVADVAASEEFAAFASFALPLNIRAGSSSPIVSSTGKVLGTVANYYRQARVPQPQDNLLDDIATRTAAIIIERKQAEEALRRSEQELAEDLQVMTRLHEVGTLCAQPDCDVEKGLGAIVKAAIAVTAADKGNIQLWDPASGALVLTAHRGFEPPFLKFFARVRDEASACGAAMQRGERVVVEDVSASPIFVGTPALDVMLAADARACQSTPLVSTAGRLLGMISTHYRRPHRPSERALRQMDLLARQAADFLERKRAEEAQRYQSEQFETLLNQAPLGVYLIGGDFRIRQVSPIALPVFGDIPDLIGRDFDEVIHILWTKEYADEVVRIFRHTLETGEPYHTPERTEYRIDRGVTEYHDWRIDRIPLPEGGYGVVCYFRDISAQVHTREELQKLNAELEERVVQRTAELLSSVAEREKLQEQLFQAQKMESIGVLAGGIAHDFNNILNIIQGYASILSADSSENKQTGESLTIINESIQRGSALVQQLLTLARKGSTQRESVNANAVIEGLIALITQTFPKMIELSSSLEADLPPITADKTQIEQALLNLCVNARDAMAGGGSLMLKTQCVDGASLQGLKEIPEKRYVCIEVTDTGMGMNESVQERIFEPFFTTKDRGQGTGLGLSVVYGIVKNHRGFIDVNSKPMSGTTFRLYFPIVDSEITFQKPATKLDVERSVTSNGTATVLLVEDEKNMLDLLQKVLLKQGYQVLMASDGEKALEIFLGHKDIIDVVLLDIGLPKIAGRDVLSKMKQASPEVKIVVVSGYLDLKLQSEIDRMGVKDFLAKPYLPDKLVTTIQSLIEKSAKPALLSHQHQRLC